MLHIMEENWVVLKEYISDTPYHLKGDKLFLSDKGRLKYNDDILDYGNGLYIGNDYQIHVVGYQFKYKNIHRTVYAMFKEIPHNDIYHNVHHIDFDHYNNDINNLIELTVEDHGKIHSELDINWGYIMQRDYKVKKLLEQKDELIENTKRLWRERVLRYKEEQKELLKKEKEQKKKEKLATKEKELQLKLEQGICGISNDGKVYNKSGLDKMHQARIGSTNSIESNLKRSLSLKERYKNDKEYRMRVCKTKGKRRYFNEETQRYYYE